MQRWLIGLVATLCLLVSYPSEALAQTTPKNRGLLITPVRSYVDIDAGDQLTRSFTVVNLTDKPIKVRFSVETFSVADFGYDYKFAEPENDWIKLVTPEAVIEPNKNHEAAYRITAPSNAAPGGHYYSLFASADLSQVGLEGTVRAATLLYLTVNGDLVRTSQIKNASAPRIVLTPKFSYDLEVKNTGNIHYFAYASARIENFLYQASPSGSSSLLMPRTTRVLAGTVNSPLIPGIYKLTYGYKSDAGDIHERSQYLLFIPPWFLAAAALLALAGFKVWRRKKRTSPTDS